MCYLCEAYQFGIDIRNNLHDTDLVTAFENLNRSIDAIEDGYSAWHPAPLSFRAMVLSFIFMEITGDSYAAFTRQLTHQPKIATLLGFSRVPDESAFSRAWRNRFDDAVQEYVQTAAHFVVKEVRDFDILAPEVQPKAEIVEDVQVAEDSAEDESFSEDEILRTTRLARIEHKQKLRRINSGIKAAQNAGKWTGRPPRGFTVGDDKRLHVDTEEFLNTREALARIARGESRNSVANDTGIPVSTLSRLYDTKLNLYFDATAEDDRIDAALEEIRPVDGLSSDEAGELDARVRQIVQEELEANDD